MNPNSTVGSMTIANTNDSTKNQSCTYAADDLNRLKSANCGSVWSQTLTYDPMGNITKTAGMNYPAAYGARNQVTDPLANRKYKFTGKPFGNFGNLSS